MTVCTRAVCGLLTIFVRRLATVLVGFVREHMEKSGPLAGFSDLWGGERKPTIQIFKKVHALSSCLRHLKVQCWRTKTILF